MARACRDDLPDGHSEIFFASGLDDPNQVESLQENSFSAHAIARSKDAKAADMRKISTDLPVGQFSWGC